MTDLSGAVHFRSTGWKGPAGLNLQQGVKWNGKEYFVFQADKTTTGENLVIRRYDASLNYRGCQTAKNGGHGSAGGVTLLNQTTTRIYTHGGNRGLLTFNYEVGNPNPPKISSYPAVGYTTGISVNNAANRLSIRKGGSSQTINWFPLDQILKGSKPKSLYQLKFKTPTGATYQGHYNYGSSDWFAWELNKVRGSKGYRKWIEEWKDGKKVREITTTSYIPSGEPEGLFAGPNGLMFVVKQFGKDRHLIGFPVPGATKAASTEVATQLSE